MADTSIGGKAGINLPQGKNLLSAFKLPKAVIADVATLQSLPPREFASGMAEVIKQSRVVDPDLFTRISYPLFYRFGHYRIKGVCVHQLPAV
jgi:3-dehydroquinate synthetase